MNLYHTKFLEEALNQTIDYFKDETHNNESKTHYLEMMMVKLYYDYAFDMCKKVRTLRKEAKFYKGHFYLSGTSLIGLNIGWGEKIEDLIHKYKWDIDLHNCRGFSCGNVLDIDAVNKQYEIDDVHKETRTTEDMPEEFLEEILKTII